MAVRSIVWICGAASIIVGPALAQERWTWPQQPTNLQVLPKDSTGEQLRPVMRGFSRALGVRCSYCHVGEDGKPLSTFDFASDANPNKDRAREMLRMLDSIDGHLQKIEPSSDVRVEVSCHTCHRGRPRPLTLADELAIAASDGGAAAALARYEELWTQYHGRGAFDFGEGALNAFGYELLAKGDTDGAIIVFERNSERFADSANVWDSLAEAYLKAGNRELAMRYYTRSLELDPGNRSAKEALERLAE